MKETVKHHIHIHQQAECRVERTCRSIPIQQSQSRANKPKTLSPAKKKLHTCYIAIWLSLFCFVSFHSSCRNNSAEEENTTNTVSIFYHPSNVPFGSSYRSSPSRCMLLCMYVHISSRVDRSHSME